MKNGVIYQTDFPNLKLLSRGKVRDNYDVGGYFLPVTTDRISAFDVVMPNPVPGKGEVLNYLSIFWMRLMEKEGIMKTALVTADANKYPASCREYAEQLSGRSVLMHKAVPFKAECIVRGYLSGSGWKSYQKNGTVCGIKLPDGLKESSKLPEPIFTPSTKAPDGEHDINITFEEFVKVVGGYEIATFLKQRSIAVYERACRHTEQRGIIIADTKMEFGLLENGELILIDELLTPDSSRFWPKNEYEEGRPQRSFDKQFLRDYLLSTNWDQKPPAPQLPAEIIKGTEERYQEALQLLTA